jgi:hypothetical protein
VFLGTDTPIATIKQTVKTARPDLTVLTSFDPALLETEGPALRRLSKLGPLLLGGPGATAALCSRLRIGRLDGDLVAAANEIGQAQVSEHRARSGARPQGASSSTQAAPIGAPDHAR